MIGGGRRELEIPSALLDDEIDKSRTPAMVGRLLLHIERGRKA